MIVKVQLPFAGHGMDMALVYTRDRKEFKKLVPITQSLRDKMGKDMLAFFTAHRENAELIIDNRLKDQGW